MSHNCEPINDMYFSQQIIHISEQNISYITSPDTYTDKHALTANCRAGLLAYLLAAEAFFGEFRECTPMMLNDPKEMLPGLSSQSPGQLLFRCYQWWA